MAAFPGAYRVRTDVFSAIYTDLLQILHYKLVVSLKLDRLKVLWQFTVALFLKTARRQP